METLTRLANGCDWNGHLWGSQPSHWIMLLGAFVFCLYGLHAAKIARDAWK